MKDKGKIIPILWEDGHSGVYEVRLASTPEAAKRIVEEMKLESSEDITHWKFGARGDKLWYNYQSWIEIMDAVEIED
jgi:hypothetical protein